MIQVDTKRYDSDASVSTTASRGNRRRIRLVLEANRTAAPGISPETAVEVTFDWPAPAYAMRAEAADSLGVAKYAPRKEIASSACRMLSARPVGRTPRIVVPCTKPTIATTV